ncbi:MAG TPA: Minf_1886 family protein [Gemmatimonadales bacterium]|nr:Minf_1886 family protein [Gemmatimonadales bacterium]
MTEVQFADDVLARIRAREERYHERAYLFVLAAIEFLQSKLPERRHVSGAELAGACRDLALRQYGLLAPAVLAHWGVVTTRDFGRIVFTLIDVKLLSAQPTDRLEDFDAIYEFDDAFSPARVWAGVNVPGVVPGS